jgi:hypothetical protein
MEEVPLDHHKKKQPLALGVEHGRLKKKDCGFSAVSWPWFAL